MAIRRVRVAAGAIAAGNAEGRKAFGFRRSNPRALAIMRTADWMEKRGKALAAPGLEPLESTDWHYHTGRLPVSAAFDQRVTYYAGGDGVFIPLYGPGTTRSELAEICLVKRVSFIFWDGTMAARYPELQDLAAHPDFALLDRIRVEDAEVRIFAFLPHVQMDGTARPRGGGQ